ncbi:Uncharacterised protein [Legionella busanensis]|uniref:Uncharacterized protein n=1 Tax=Legionella busanensis TaxID=190655 RepID=A0A378JJL2_9GAMM|nr:hypothetical protein [Legionella busanensis]STX51405.1 Uncharacterised protein [Legionella busanensis]
MYLKSESSPVTTPSRSKDACFNSNTLAWKLQSKNPFAYLILNKKGITIATSELDNPLQKVAFLRQESETEEKGSSYVYIVFRGEMASSYPSIPIQLIFMKRRYFGSEDSLHPKVYEVAIDNFKIEDICNIYNIKLNIDIKDGKPYYYFSGEFKISLEVRSLASLLNKKLEYFIFDTRGTKTDDFRKETSPQVDCYIPRDCMRFNPQYDEFLEKKMIFPESRDDDETKFSKSEIALQAPSALSGGGMEKSTAVAAALAAPAAVADDETKFSKSEIALQAPSELSVGGMEDSTAVAAALAAPAAVARVEDLIKSPKAAGSKRTFSDISFSEPILAAQPEEPSQTHVEARYSLENQSHGEAAETNKNTNLIFCEKILGSKRLFSDACLLDSKPYAPVAGVPEKKHDENEEKQEEIEPTLKKAAQVVIKRKGLFSHSNTSDERKSSTAEDEQLTAPELN